jgi:hypothetical protein
MGIQQQYAYSVEMNLSDLNDSYNMTKMEVMVECVGEHGDVLDTGYVEKDVKYYSISYPPKDLTITSSDNIITITALFGDNASNNPASGVEIYYTTDGTEPTEKSTLYTKPFKLQSSTENVVIKAMARTVGTYRGNNYYYYYSSPIYAVLNDVVTYGSPGVPTSLSITDTGNNSFYF